LISETRSELKQADTGLSQSLAKADQWPTDPAGRVR